MRGIVCLKVSTRSVISMVAITISGPGLSHIAVAQSDLDSTSATVVARGGGTTIIQGGTGKSGGFVPVLTTLGFHAERKGGIVTGDFECLARAPENSTGPGSAQFTKNVMYVTGQITGATVVGDTATLTGTAEITGLGAGTNVSFTFVVRAGGPGSAAVLTTEGSPRLVFNETLLEGSIDILPGHRREQ
ncbi:MAG: hypothetical protein JO138_05440 [Acidobacteriaceae bacterium]|nr:hypothetical protein [Acidobacteriaceae bacterium]